MKKLIILLNLFILVVACSANKSNRATLHLVVEKQKSYQKSVWGDTTNAVDEINCIGVFISYPPSEAPAGGTCKDTNGNVITTPAVAAGTIPFNYNNSSEIMINVLAGENRKIELIGFETHLPACPPFFGIDDYMKLNSAPLMVLDTKVINIPAGSSEVTLNGIFSNKKILDKCEGNMFMWPAPIDKGLFVGGNFSQVAGQIQPGLAHIGLHDGGLNVTMDASVPGTINTMDYDYVRQILYVGGSFTTIKSVSKKNLAAIDMLTRDVITAFSPEPDADVYSIKLYDNGNYMIVGGQHTYIGGVVPQANLAKIQTSDGNLKADFNPSVGSKVYAVHVDESMNRVYYGGEFTLKVAAVNLNDGSTFSSFNPSCDGNVYAIAATPGSSIIYIGGSFTTIDASPSAGIAALDGDNGDLIPTFDTTVSAVSGTVRSLALNMADSTLYIGGEFPTVGGVSRNNLAAVNSLNGSLKPFNPNVSTSAGGVKTIAFRNDLGLVYYGGNIMSVGSAGNVEPRNGLAVSFMDDGALLGIFDAQLSSGSVNAILIP